MEQRDHDGSGGQDDQGWLELPRVDMCAQVSEPVRGEPPISCTRTSVVLPLPESS
jgi:hypothetical protein